MSTDDLYPALAAAMPVATTAFATTAETGLILVDLVNGFCTPGAGPLAPAGEDAEVAAMVARCAALARAFRQHKRPVLAFLDTHQADRPEPPYPPHCLVGSGHEDLVQDLAWLAQDPDVTVVRKDCIDGFVGALEPVFAKGTHGLMRNKLLDWVNAHRLEAVVIAGICTDVCVMDCTISLLSARNHHLAPTLRDIVVLEPACATYDLPAAVAAELGMPATAAHPRAAAHHVGLWAMAQRGAVIAGELTGA